MSASRIIPLSGTGTTANKVDIVVCTFDRPAALERLLRSVLEQRMPLPYGVIVVDNDPASQSTDPVRRLFPQVRWVAEPRQGLAFARNAGIRVTCAPVVVFADDDMEVGPDWLRCLTAPVLSGEFDVTLGPVLPMRLVTEAERLFEAYGGHGHAGTRAVYDADWLRSRRWCLPLWQIGGIGNSAIRRSLFSEETVGGFEQALGAGTPAGSSEDLYFLYHVLRAKGTALREPAAQARHAHRDTLDGLAAQLSGYRRGEVCFCLLVLLRHGDLRAIAHLGLFIPSWRLRLLAEEVLRRARGRSLFPFRLMVREFASYLLGPAALLVSLRRASRLQRSLPGDADVTGDAHAAAHEESLR